MDDIANKLGCSKKTLYVFFENRKELVLKVISNDMNKHELDINNVIAKKLHPIEEILSLNVIAINKLKTCHPSFQYDLKKYYPKSWEIFDRNNKQLTYKTCIKNLKKGIKNGCYRKDINPRFYQQHGQPLVCPSINIFSVLLFCINDKSRFKDGIAVGRYS